MRLPAVSARLVGALALVFAAQAASAQPGWRAYPAYNEVVAVAGAPDGVWAGTDAGLFFYGVPDGEIATYSAVDGLRGGELGAIAYDAARGVLWVGYGDGLVERLEPEDGRITPFYAIARADQYPSRGVRRVRVAGDRLYLATDFGAVVFDAEREEVRATYARLADLPAATAVNDVLEAPLPDGRPGLWLATEGGVVYAARDADNLQSPTAWTRAPGFEGPALSLAAFDGTVYAGGGPAGRRDLYRRSAAGTWDRQLDTDHPITTLLPDGDRLVAVSPAFAFVVRPGRGRLSYDSGAVKAMRDAAVGPGGTVWVGDAAAGLVPLPPPTVGDGPNPYAPEPVAPPGPYTNRIADVDVGPDGVLWLVTQGGAAGASAVNRFERGVWTTFLTSDPTLDIARSGFRSASVGPDGAFYAGAEGGGLTVFAPDGAVTTYDEENSSLESPAGFPGFVRVSDVGFEGDRRWVLSLAERVLHLFDADGRWTSLPTPVPVLRDVADARIAIDRFGQKWIALRAGGLVVWDTETGRADRFTDSAARGEGLPNSDVRDVVVDPGGRVWIGTARGIAYVFDPGSAFGGDLGRPQWARTADGLSYLLLDVEVNDLEADPAGQVWIATTTGAYLLNAEGNAVVRQVTSENSPLPSDEVLAVSVDPVSGRVYFVTSEGLFSLAGDATAPQPGAEALRVAPNPLRPEAGGAGAVVSGLSASRSSVRVMTVGGDVVYAAEVTGGSFRWDGTDQRTGRPAPSGVYLVAAAGDDGSTLYGKVAVVR